MQSNEEEFDIRLKGPAYWLILLMQVPFPIMWISKYDGVLFPLWAIASLLVFGFFHWKTTTYTYRFGPLDKDARKRAFQQSPWVPTAAIYAIFVFPTLGLIAKSENASELTVYLCYGAFAIIAILGVIEGIRKIRI